MVVTEVVVVVWVAGERSIYIYIGADRERERRVERGERDEWRRERRRW